MQGQSFGGGETECKDESEYCYNVTAMGGALFEAARAGCSYYRSAEGGPNLIVRWNPQSRGKCVFDSIV